MDAEAIIIKNLSSWSKDEQRELISQINKLSTNFREGLLDILKNKKLKSILGEYIRFLLTDRKDIKYIINTYETVTSKNMLHLIENYNKLITHNVSKPIKSRIQYQNCKHKMDVIDVADCILSRSYGDLLKQAILDILQNDKLIEGIKISNIYMEIHSLIDGWISYDTQPNNTSIVFHSNQNSERSEFIEDLGITTYEQIIDNFNRFEYIKSESTSDTIILSAYLNLESAKTLNNVRALSILNSPKLVFKIYPTDLADSVTEKNIYEELFKLVKYNVTPNILCKVGTTYPLKNFYTGFIKKIYPWIFKSDFKYIEKHTIKETIKRINTKLQIAQNDAHLWETTIVVMTQYGDNMLENILSRNIKPDNFDSVMFQLLYTLYVFEQIKFCHGDLHAQNIFVNKLKNPIDLYYRVDGMLYKITTNLIVKIYDFDHSTIYKSTTINVNSTERETINAVINSKVSIGRIDLFNKNLDKLKLILYLVKKKQKIYTTFIKNIFPGFINRETIKTTYKRLLFSDANHLKNLEEANIVFGIVDDEYKDDEYKDDKQDEIIKKFNISEEILNLSWSDYFKKITIHYDFIVKNFDIDSILKKENHLWIPDEIIFSYKKILTDNFGKYLVHLEKKNEPQLFIPVLVYSLDNRIKLQE